MGQGIDPLAYPGTSPATFEISTAYYDFIKLAVVFFATALFFVGGYMHGGVKAGARKFVPGTRKLVWRKMRASAPRGKSLAKQLEVIVRRTPPLAIASAPGAR
jgi:hypothetical protein